MNLGDLHRQEYGRILASLIRVVHDFTLAEDAVQEAFAAAHLQWPAQGTPSHPVAWLMSTARHKAIDQIRRRDLISLLPEEPEAEGLLALLLLHHARQSTRMDAGGDLVLLENQDRTRWNSLQIAEGAALVESALRRSPPGPYTLQAAISALHAQAPSFDKTNWAQIAALYRLLAKLQPSPVIELNRAIAIAMSGELENALALLEKIKLPGYHLLPAAKADILRRLNKHTEAAEAYREALDLVDNTVEQRFLAQRLAEVLKDRPVS